MLHGNAETLGLALLAEDEQYGYQIRKDLATRSHHYFQFAFGRPYPLLAALERPSSLRQRAGLGEGRQVSATKTLRDHGERSDGVAGAEATLAAVP